jgi:hypothetical protein
MGYVYLLENNTASLLKVDATIFTFDLFAFNIRNSIAIWAAAFAFLVVIELMNMAAGGYEQFMGFTVYISHTSTRPH